MSESVHPGDAVAACFRDLIGTDAVETRAAVRTFRIDDRVPQCVLFPSTVEQVSQCVAAADAAGLATIPAGNGTHLGVGLAPRAYDVALSTRRLRRVLAHEAADMTATVEAGVTLAELNDSLTAANQRLPVDPPHPEHMTIGGLIAGDASGPLRLAHGTVRDLLIGIKVVLADGTVVSGGGRVVKNVAGYDLMKLLTGSFGTLGIIVEATFKVRPRPEHTAVFVLPAATTAAAMSMAREVLAAPLDPSYVEALSGLAARHAGVATDGAAVVVGCEGSAAEIDTQRARLQACFAELAMQTCVPSEATRLTTALRDFPTDALATVAAAARRESYGCTLSMLPSRLATLLSGIEAEGTRQHFEPAMLSHVGNGVAIVRFSAAADRTDALPPFAAWLRSLVREAGGFVVFDALPAAHKVVVDPWGAQVPGLDLMRGIKQTLDPNGRLSPGRFVGGI